MATIRNYSLEETDLIIEYLSLIDEWDMISTIQI